MQITSKTISGRIGDCQATIIYSTTPLGAKLTQIELAPKNNYWTGTEWITLSRETQIQLNLKFHKNLWYSPAAVKALLTEYSPSGA